jgi:hypothetical protein
MTVLVLSIISSLTALVAVIVGPLVQLRVAKKQIRSTTVSANRQAWINSLRDNLATLRAYSSDVRGLRTADTNDPSLTAKIQKKGRRANVLLAKVRLSLNPTEKDHQELMQRVQQLWDISDSVSPNNAKGEEWERNAQDLMTVAQRILKAEWNRVKEGD